MACWSERPAVKLLGLSSTLLTDTTHSSVKKKSTPGAAPAHHGSCGPVTTFWDAAEGFLEVDVSFYEACGCQLLQVIV